MTTAVAKEKDTTGFGKRLRVLRELRGLTLETLGGMCKPAMGYQAVARLERGERTPSWETVLRLCEALGVSAEEFMPEGE